MGMTTVNLALLLSVAERAGCAETVLMLARRWPRSLGALGRLRRLRREVSHPGWAHLARLLAEVDRLASGFGEGRELGWPSAAREDLLAAARCRIWELAKRERGGFEALIERLERPAAASVGGKEGQRGVGLSARIGRLEAAILELSRDEETAGRKRARERKEVRETSRRLTAEGLSRLLAVAVRHGLAGMCEAMIEHSRRGRWLHDRLEGLAGQVGERFPWSHLAELLSTVDRLADQVGEWPLPVVQLDLKRLPLADLHAAAQLRCAELLLGERGAHRELLRLLGEEIHRERKDPVPGLGKPREVRDEPKD